MQKLRPFYRDTAVFFFKKIQNSSLLIFVTTRTLNTSTYIFLNFFESFIIFFYFF